MAVAQVVGPLWLQGCGPVRNKGALSLSDPEIPHREDCMALGEGGSAPLSQALKALTP